MTLIFALAALLAAPPRTAPADIQIHIDEWRDRHPISPYVYGSNFADWKGTGKGLTLTRVGGNRMTAYNWETNASNAGNDYHFQNDAYLGGDDIPGEVERKPATEAFAAGASIILTVPIAGYVSADKKADGDVRQTPDHLNTRFLRSLPRKGKPFVYPPDTTDRVVYQDEFVAFLERTFPNAHKDPQRTLFYCLDNEPALWDSTHAEIRTTKLTYQELMQKSLDFAAAIKAVAPKALIFGPVSYGWAGMTTLQGAPDANGRNFLDFYLASMRDAERSSGKRLLDVLDVHWYPEARGGGKRITESGSDPALIRARLQAPRSLWDPTYTEESWIVAASTHGPIRLLPRLKEQIANNYPGTKLAITEYNYGGGADVSGALAEADVLGVFGREGLFAAAFWPLGRDDRFIFGGFAMYRNFDGQGAKFGDTSIFAATSDVEHTSAYAAVDSHDPGRLTIVLINKTDAPLSADIHVVGRTNRATAAVYQLTSAGPAPKPAGRLHLDRGSLRYQMPPMSVSTLALHR